MGINVNLSKFNRGPYTPYSLLYFWLNERVTYICMVSADWAVSMASSWVNNSFD